METLTASQLAFLLGIKVDAARRKMIVAHCKETGAKLNTWEDESGQTQYR